jgi:hypothetical protein
MPIVIIHNRKKNTISPTIHFKLSPLQTWTLLSHVLIYNEFKVDLQINKCFVCHPVGSLPDPVDPVLWLQMEEKPFRSISSIHIGNQFSRK